MTSRQRGAAYVLAVLVLGRVLDALDLPFEAQPEERSSGASSLAPESPNVADSSAEAGVATRNAPSAAARDSAAAGDSRGRRRAAPERAAPGSPVRVNAASAAELQALPGVGPVMAQRILEYRAAHGPLHSLTDLRRVKGIGPRTCERLASLVRFD